MHERFGVHWYYNWMARPGSSDREFVPMIKGGKGAHQGNYDRIRELADVTHLLGFNEPERESQGDLELEEALDLWPGLVELAESAGLKLGSPAPSSDKLGMDYFHEFMDRAGRMDYRIDFIAVHWYRSRDPGAFEDFVEELAREYRLPVWVTEFNGWSGPEDEHYDFLKDALRYLERSRRVERYAYFNPAAGEPHSLLTSDGSLTRLGELYREAGN